MSGFSKAVLTFGLVAAFTTPAWAQGRGGMMGGMMGGGGVQLITNASVQKEIKLEEEQAEKVKGVAEELRGNIRESMSSLQDLEPQDRMKKMQEIQRTTNEAGMKALGVILKPDQMKRFHEVVLQQEGPAVLATHPMLAKKLKVSDEQVGKITAIQAEMRTEMRDLRDASDPAAAMAKLRKTTNDKALAVMTDSQKKEWKDMLGEPFEIKMEGGPGGFGGGRPRTKGNN